MDNELDVSVVIVNWNAAKDLGECLDSLHAQTDPHFRTVVVDNGSTDGSIELVRSKYPWATLIAAGENLGFAEGCNRGIAATTEPWVAMLNNDAVAAPDWMAELRKAAREGGDRLGMVQSKIVFRQKPDHTNSTGVLIFQDGGFIDRGYDQPLDDNDHVEEIFCASAGAALYRRSMLEGIRLESGYFDRTFFMYYEDVDLGWRARLAGWSAVYAPTAIVFHAFHGSANRRGQNFVRLSCNKNRVRTVLKNGSGSYMLRVVPRIGRELVWSLWNGRWAYARNFVHAVRDGLAQRPLVTRTLRVDRRSVEDRWVVR